MLNYLMDKFFALKLNILLIDCKNKARRWKIELCHWKYMS